MTVFDPLYSDGVSEDPENATYDATKQRFNLMRGYRIVPLYPDGTPYDQIFPYAVSHGIVTSYCFPGDPVTQSGWIDGIDEYTSDRRFVAATVRPH